MSYPRTAAQARRAIASRKKATPRHNLMMAFCSNVDQGKGKGGEKLTIGKNCVLADVARSYSKPIPCSQGYSPSGKLKDKCFTRILISEGHPAPVTYRKRK